MNARINIILPAATVCLLLAVSDYAQTIVSDRPHPKRYVALQREAPSRLAPFRKQTLYGASNQSVKTTKRAKQGKTDALTTADRAAIRALEATFVRGWLNDDMNAVLGVFAQDAVLLPPGSNPIRGISAIRSYWFPEDGSHTKITSFDRHLEEVGGNRDLAFLRSTASLSWTYEKNGQKQNQVSRSNELLLLQRDSDGHWRITCQMWNALPS